MKNKTRYKELLNEFKSYIYKNKYVFLISTMILFVIYGRELYTINARVDTEVFINEPSSVYNWLLIGRQGAIFSRILFEQLNFNPYFVTVLGLIFYAMSMIVFSYLLNYIGRVRSTISVLGFLIFLVHPIWVEQFYFKLQVLPVSLGVLFTFVAVLISFFAIINNDMTGKVVSVILMIWSFSTYQSFMILYIATTILCFLLYKKQSIDTESKMNIYLKVVIYEIILFLISFIINTIITKIFFSAGEDYLSSQIKWGVLSNRECIMNILIHIKSVLLSEGVFYTNGYTISLILFLISFGYSLINGKFKSYKWLYILAGIGLQLCPFLITIYGGTVPAFRAQFVLPFIIAGNFLFTLNVWKAHKYIKNTIYLVCICIFILQAQAVFRMQYTDDIRFQEDMRIASQISERVSQESNVQNKPVAFIGKRQSQLNSASIRGEFIGTSIFNVDNSAEPHYFHSTGRITGILKTMGYNIIGASPEQILEARKIAVGMPSWPALGSVYDAGDFVIVKLSEDNWYADDIMPSNIEKSDISNVKFDNTDIKWCVDESKVENNQLRISGWMIKTNIPSNQLKINVYIYNEENNEFYKLQTAKTERQDLNKAFPNEADYTDSGYVAKGNISDIINNIDKFRIILEYSSDKEDIYVDTGKYIK